MIKPYSAEQAKQNSFHYYLDAILKEMSEKINIEIEKASKDGYHHATIIYREHHLKDPEQLNTIASIIRQEYYTAGYEDVDANWDAVSDYAEFAEYVISLSW